jgi:hypothetical protein
METLHAWRLGPKKRLKRPGARVGRGGRDAENGSQSRSFLPPFHRYIGTWGFPDHLSRALWEVGLMQASLAELWERFRETELADVFHFVEISSASWKDALHTSSKEYGSTMICLDGEVRNSGSRLSRAAFGANQRQDTRSCSQTNPRKLLSTLSPSH